MTGRLYWLPPSSSQWVSGQSLDDALKQIYKLFLAGAIDEAELARLDAQLRARQGPPPPSRPTS